MFAIRYLVAVAALLSAESVAAQNMCDVTALANKVSNPAVLVVVATNGVKCISDSGINLATNAGALNTPDGLAKLCSVPECVQILEALRGVNPGECMVPNCSTSTSSTTGSMTGTSGQNSTTGGTGVMGSLTGSHIGAGSQHVGGTGSMTAPENSSLPNPAESGSNGGTGGSGSNDGTGGSGGNGATALAATSTVAAVATVAVLML